MVNCVIFAQDAKPAGSPLDRPEIILGSAGLVGALLAGALVIFLVDRWRKRSALADVADAGSELTSFRAMYERGEITEEEYNRLRQKVSERVKSPAEARPASAGLVPPQIGGEGVTGSADTDRRPYLPGPLPPEYFEDPDPPGRRPGEPPTGDRPPPA